MMEQYRLPCDWEVSGSKLDRKTGYSEIFCGATRHIINWIHQYPVYHQTYSPATSLCNGSPYLHCMSIIIHVPLYLNPTYASENYTLPVLTRTGFCLSQKFEDMCFFRPRLGKFGWATGAVRNVQESWCLLIYPVYVWFSSGQNRD
jgi:hypothetical protein